MTTLAGPLDVLHASQRCSPPISLHSQHCTPDLGSQQYDTVEALSDHNKGLLPACELDSRTWMQELGMLGKDDAMDTKAMVASTNCGHSFTWCNQLVKSRSTSILERKISVASVILSEKEYSSELCSPHSRTRKPTCITRSSLPPGTSDEPSLKRSFPSYRLQVIQHENCSLDLVSRSQPTSPTSSVWKPQNTFNGNGGDLSMILTAPTEAHMESLAQDEKAKILASLQAAIHRAQEFHDSLIRKGYSPSVPSCAQPHHHSDASPSIPSPPETQPLWDIAPLTPTTPTAMAGMIAHPLRALQKQHPAGAFGYTYSTDSCQPYSNGNQIGEGHAYGEALGDNRDYTLCSITQKGSTRYEQGRSFEAGRNYCACHGYRGINQHDGSHGHGPVSSVHEQHQSCPGVEMLLRTTAISRRAREMEENRNMVRTKWAAIIYTLISTLGILFACILDEKTTDRITFVVMYVLGLIVPIYALVDYCITRSQSKTKLVDEQAAFVFHI